MKHFYGACIFYNASYETQQTQSVGVIINGDMEDRPGKMEPPKYYGGKAVSNRYALIYVRKMTRVSEDLVVIRS